MDDGGGEVFFNYTKPGSDDLNYYTDIPKEYITRLRMRLAV
ncbi:immunity protein YezG family protein [Staphylococcus aureus]